MGEPLDDLIAQLEDISQTFKTSKTDQYFLSLSVVTTYLDRVGVPATLSAPLSKLRSDILHQKSEGNKKPSYEAHVMATAAAAVTLGSPDKTDEQLEAASQHVAEKLEKAGFRVMKDKRKWGWKSLKNHRHSLEYHRASEGGKRLYFSYINALERRDDITPTQKMDMMIDGLLQIM